MNKIIVSILAYNSEMFIKYCLDGIYDFADKIVIVEGSYGLQRAFGLRSTDRTIEIVKNYPDLQKKIVFLQKNGKEHEHRNEVLKYCEPGDWFFTVHTDEFYIKSHLKYLKDLLAKDKETDVYELPWFEFYYNFRLGIDGSYSSARIYRVREGCRFIRKDQLSTADGRQYYKMNFKRMDRNNILMFHYAYIYNVKKKMMYYGRKKMRWYNEVFTKFTPENADAIYKKNEEITGKYGIHPLGEESLVLAEFRGEHPEVMKDHPLRDRDLIEEFKRGYEEPGYDEGGIFGKLMTGLKYHYYKLLRND
jgi:hypothetical protein